MHEQSAFFNFYLCQMQSTRGFLIFILMSSSMLSAQSSYLGRPELLSMVESCLNHTYNFSFEQARKDQQELKRITPDHPAPYFLEALIHMGEFPDNSGQFDVKTLC